LKMDEPREIIIPEDEASAPFALYSRNTYVPPPFIGSDLDRAPLPPDSTSAYWTKWICQVLFDGFIFGSVVVGVVFLGIALTNALCDPAEYFNIFFLSAGIYVVIFVVILITSYLCGALGTQFTLHQNAPDLSRRNEYNTSDLESIESRRRAEDNVARGRFLEQNVELGRAMGAVEIPSAPSPEENRHPADVLSALCPACPETSQPQGPPCIPQAAAETRARISREAAAASAAHCSPRQYDFSDRTNFEIPCDCRYDCESPSPACTPRNICGQSDSPHRTPNLAVAHAQQYAERMSANNAAACRRRRPEPSTCTGSQRRQCPTVPPTPTRPDACSMFLNPQQRQPCQQNPRPGVPPRCPVEAPRPPAAAFCRTDDYD